MDKSKSSTASSATSAEYSTKVVSAVSKQVTTSTTVAASTEVFQPRPRRMVQNFLLVWLDANIDERKEDFQKSLTELQKIFVTIETFTDVDQCVDYLTSIDDQEIYLITTASIGQTTIPLIHDIAQLDKIFVFCSSTDSHRAWAKEWSKVRDIYDSIQSICTQLTKVTQSCDHDAMPMSFVPERTASEVISNKQSLDQLPPSYMYSVIFKEIILEIDDDDDEKSMNTLVNFCQQQKILEKDIDAFKRNYYEKSAVWCYTRNVFLYGMLNRALRMLDMEVMIKLGFFIRRLHIQLEQLHQAQLADFQKVFTVYRGQRLSKQDFQKLCDSKGGLLSFNNFLSTSKDRDFSMVFAESASIAETDIVGVLFIMSIDQTKISTSITPFAMIDEHSAHPQEQEILFTMHTVFRVDEITQTASNSRLWEVQLTITDDNDPQLSTLTNRIKEEVQRSTGWHRMGRLMLKVGHLDQAEELYNELLKGASTDSDIAAIYHQLGYLKDDQGEYKDAVEFYEKSLEIYRKTLPEDDASLAPTYTNIGGVYNNMGEYSKALEYYEKDLEITKKALPPTHPDLATSYNNIGGVYDSMGEYSKALEYYEKSLKIREISLPPTHPDLATSYNNIGVVYYNMGDCTKALESHEKSLKIREKALPPNHPDLAYPYNWLGRINRNMKDYEKALSYFQISISIREQALPEKHPNRAVTYSDIGDVHRLMGDYERALAFHQKALNIQENVKCNPLDCATTYINLGETYREMKDYTTALTYYQKGLKIREEKLAKTHPDLAVIYHNMSKLYFSTQKYSMAMKYVQQAVEIGQEKLPATHPHLVEYRETFEKIRKKQ